MTTPSVPSPSELPLYEPALSNVPDFLQRRQCGYHYTEPWIVEEILRCDHHLSTRYGNRRGVYLADESLSPANADAQTLLNFLFVGNRLRAPSLWAVLVYRTHPPDRTGLAVFPTQRVLGEFFASVGRSGIYPVSDFLLAAGWAVPTQTGVRWAWWWPGQP